jgi:sigma-B regulation protein RsbU (phosphoserine phosphatase)
MTAFASRQLDVWHALVGTVPGRAIVIGFAVRVTISLAALAAGPLPPLLDAAGTGASLMMAIGGGYFLVRGFILLRRRLLWRVRRKLILSYIYIGFVPVILIVVLSLLGVFLLFTNFSAYLVQSRLRTLSDRARSIATTTALEIQRSGSRAIAEIVEQRLGAAEREFPNASMAIVPADRACGAAGSAVARLEMRPHRAGAWAHMDPPASVPAWIDCAGFAGLIAYVSPGAARDPTPLIVADDRGLPPPGRTHLIVRAIAFPDVRAGYAVVLDLPVDDAENQRLRHDTGVALTNLQIASSGTSAQPSEGNAGPARPPPTGPISDLPLPSASILQYRDWTTGETGRLIASMQLSIGEIYSRLSAQEPSGPRTFGGVLLLVLIIVGVLFLIIEAAALAAGLSLARSITRSVHELFVGTERVRQGDFSHKIAVVAPDQLGELAQSFNSMTASIDDLLRQAAEKKRLEEELRIAHEIQMSLLPQGPLRMAGLSVTALCVPARQVGGDYYDFLPLGEDRVGVLIADVSGKGTSAALYMAELKGLVLSLSRIHESPRELLVTANGIIAEHLDARSFITMTYAVVDLRARTMTFARAGHTPLIYLPAQGDGVRGVQVLAPDGLVLGLKIDEGQLFARLLREETLPLHAGDLYLFFTDGITEAMNAGDDCFGEHRLGRLLEEHGHLPAEELRERVLREIEVFVGDAPQHDDMTMILLKIEDAPGVEEALAAAGRAVRADLR